MFLGMQVYGLSKLMNIMVAKALNEKLKGTGVEAFSAHPGIFQEFQGPLFFDNFIVVKLTVTLPLNIRSAT